MLIVVILVAGCSTTPSHIILSPQVTSKPSVIYLNQQATLMIKDLRANNHIVQVLRTDKAAQLYSPSTPLTEAISNNLTPYLNSQGLDTNGGATEINITIDRAIVSVQQELMKYQSNSDIQLTILIKKGEKTLTNTLKSTSNSKGPLQADIAVLERDLNQQLGKIVSDIANNHEFIEFIRN